MTAKPPRLYYKGNQLKQLRAFCQIARLGSITRAAEALFLSQPAVTLQLQALEQALDVRLFERSGRRLTLSPEGQTLYDLVRPLVDGLDGLDREFHSRLRGLGAGALDIAAGGSTILYLLPPLVQAFRASHPAVPLKLHAAVGNDLLDLVRSDTVDLAVGSLLDVPTDIDFVPVYTVDPMLVVPRGHPLEALPDVSVEDLSPYGLILPPQRPTTYRIVDAVFQQRRVPYSVVLEVGGWEVIKQYVATGLGISIVPAICLADTDHARLSIRSMARHFPPRAYGLAVRKGRILGPRARDFADLVRPGLFRRRDYDDTGHSER